MTDYWSYMALRLVTAAGSVGLFNEAFTMTVGEMVLGLFAFFIRDYVTLQWVMSAICFIQLPLWLLMPESPRWLLSKGRLEEARKVMERAARWNSKTVDLSAIKHQVEDKPDLLDEL